MEDGQIPLQAILLADSFGSRLRPLTLENPVALMPLVNIPMIEYMLEFLVAGGVNEIFIVVTEHSSLVKDYVHKCDWLKHEVVAIQFVVATGCLNVGDVLRQIAKMDNGINTGKRANPFVLLGGNVIATFDLAKVVQAQKSLFKANPSNIVTSVFMKAEPEHRIWVPDDDLTLLVENVQKNPTLKSSLGRKENITPQILDYLNNLQNPEIEIPIPLVRENKQIRIMHNVVDCYVDVCAPEVLKLFEASFDWADIRQHFLRGVLESELQPLNAHAFFVENAYAANAHDFASYAAISKDIVQGWTHPWTPANSPITTHIVECLRNHVYRETDVHISRTAKLEHNVVIGSETSIGDNTIISDSVIGRDVQIGNNCILIDCHIWDGCRIKNGCVVEGSILANNVELLDGAKVSKGCVLAYGVKVGAGHTVKPYHRLYIPNNLHRGSISPEPEEGEVFVTNIQENLNGKKSGVHSQKFPTSETGSRKESFDYPQNEVSDSSTDYYPSNVVGATGRGQRWCASSGESEEIDKVNAPYPNLNVITYRNPDNDQWSVFSESVYEDDDPFDVTMQEVASMLADTHAAGNDESQVSDSAREILLRQSAHNVNVQTFSCAIFFGLFLLVDPQPTLGKVTGKAHKSLEALLVKFRVLIENYRSDAIHVLTGLARAVQFPLSEFSYGEDSEELREVKIVDYQMLFLHALSILVCRGLIDERAVKDWYDDHRDLKIAVEVADFVQTLSSSEESTSSDSVS